MSRSMTEKLAFALGIRRFHNEGSMSALEAELLLLDAGFYNIRFDAYGIAAVTYLGVVYPLERSPA